ncbi:MAG: menaquinone biosynthesis decarboxylase [Verrucomicrobiae bacterium]|nr:menaquinone biosynthesis decarboxylase [Verrucomicrobiae bacterium]
MAFDSSQDWIATLEKSGELRRVRAAVRTELEITELADRQMKSPGGGQALLIEKPVGASGPCSFPLLINAMGSTRRMATALGVDDVEEVAARLGGLMKAKPPQSFGAAIKLLGQALDLRHAKPERVSSGACQEVVWRAETDRDRFGLSRLPVLKCWPDDGGPFITLPIVVTSDPDSGEVNWGMYRMQVFDDWTTAMHWQVHKVGARHGRAYEKMGKRMPVSVFLGSDPLYTFCATAPLPDGVDETLFAGFLRKKSVRLVKCLTNDHWVPADADFVLEGYVEPGERRPEGPFGDHTGFYTPIDDYPVFHLTAITHRKDAVYPATIVGKPPMEDFYMGTASVRILLPIFKLNFPEIVDMALPAEGVFHNLVFVSIRKQYPYHAFKIMNGLWGMGLMMFSKIIVIVDEHVDVQDTSDVLFHLCANVDPQRDCLFTRGPSDSLDHAPTEPNIGSHMGIDATGKVEGEGYKRGWPKEVCMPDEVRARVDQILKEAGR